MWYEQGTSRLILHDGTMRNLIYMNGWQVLQQNGIPYLYDSNRKLLYDQQLNYYYQGRYYNRQGVLLKDFTVNGNTIDGFAKDIETVKTVIKNDPVYGNGNATRNIYSANVRRNTYSGKNRNIIKNPTASNQSTIINNEIKPKTQQTVKSDSINHSNQTVQQPKVDTSKTSVQHVNNVNYQQQMVDKIVKEQLERQQRSTQQQELRKSNLETKRLTDINMEEITTRTNNIKSNQPIDTRNRPSMTQKIDEYNKIRASSSNFKFTANTSPPKTRPKVPRGTDALTVGRIITGAVKDTTGSIASKIAADFCQYRYGKRLFNFINF